MVSDELIRGERERERPEGLGEDEEAGEAHGVGGVVEEESGAVSEIWGVGGVGDVGVDKSGEVGGGDGVVEDILARNEIDRVQAERRVHVERRPAQPHHPESERVRPWTAAHLSLSLSLWVRERLKWAMTDRLFSAL